MKLVKRLLSLALVGTLGYGGFWAYDIYRREMVLNAVIERLSSETRVAEALVTQSSFNEETQRIETRLKFLEFDVDGDPLEPKYFTFEGNILQFQALVIRFDDELVKAGDSIKGKSAYLFLKAFTLESDPPQIFPITEAYTVPGGYRLDESGTGEAEAEIWQQFWQYALDPIRRRELGIKNAQIEAPGSLFMPGMLYTLKIEHDGGLRIDPQPIPEILKGEQLPKSRTDGQRTDE